MRISDHTLVKSRPAWKSIRSKLHRSLAAVAVEDGQDDVQRPPAATDAAREGAIAATISQLYTQQGEPVDPVALVAHVLHRAELWGAGTVEVWVCPDCGAQITDEPEYDPRRREYVRGHYHDPPDDWPEGEDPWFDAERREAILI